MNYRKIYEKIYGEILDGFEIHHLDHDRNNNDISNLIAVSKMVHQDYHRLYNLALESYAFTQYLDPKVIRSECSADLCISQLQSSLKYMVARSIMFTRKDQLDGTGY